MALSPLQPPEQRAIIVSPPLQTLRTYEFNFDTGELTGSMITGEAAFRQQLRKVLATPRFRHLIYSARYGSEYEDQLIGQQEVSTEYLNAEAKRLTIEALIRLDTVKSVTEITVDRRTTGEVFIGMTVASMDGLIVREEVPL